MKHIKRLLYYLYHWFWMGPIRGLLFFALTRAIDKNMLRVIIELARREQAVWLIADPDAKADDEVIKCITIDPEYITQERIREGAKRGDIIVKIETVN